jgi:cytochrome c oxidase subunit 5a
VPPSITLPPKLTNIVTGIKAKVENKTQYEQYLQELKPLREELGIPLKEDLYPEESN